MLAEILAGFAHIWKNFNVLVLLGKILLRILDLRNAVFHQLSEKALRCCCVTQPFSPNLSSFYKMQYCILLRCINEPTIGQCCDFSKPITNLFGTWYECLNKSPENICVFLVHNWFNSLLNAYWVVVHDWLRTVFQIEDPDRIHYKRRTEL